jgi:hypothetical protein
MHAEEARALVWIVLDLGVYFWLTHEVVRLVGKKERAGRTPRRG